MAEPAAPKLKKPNPNSTTVILTRHVVSGFPVWLVHSKHKSLRAAQDCYLAKIKGRGVTAWSLFVPSAVAKVLLAHPDKEIKNAYTECGIEAPRD